MQTAQIEYKSFFIAYMDILGYKNMIEETSDAESISLISKLSSAIEQTRDILKKGWSWECDDFFVRVFSDCICIAIPEKTENLDAFFQILANIQANLVRRNICIRGAVAIGKFYADENIIFSSGMIDAYKMERGIAKFPRIIIPEKFWYYVSKNGSLEDIIWFRELYTWHDYEDRQLFIDYLNFMPYNREDDPKHEGRDLKNHKNFIDISLNKYQHYEHIYEKYQWLANYHNSWCKHEYSDKAELLIERDLIPRKLGQLGDG